MANVKTYQHKCIFCGRTYQVMSNSVMSAVCPNCEKNRKNGI